MHPNSRILLDNNCTILKHEGPPTVALRAVTYVI